MISVDWKWHIILKVYLLHLKSDFSIVI